MIKGYKYKEVAIDIANKIATGEFEAKMPGVRTLAEQYHVDIKTASKAVSHLIQAGLVERRRGLGAFVSRKDSGSQISLGVVGNPPGGEFFNNFYYGEVLEGIREVLAKSRSVLAYQEKSPDISYKSLFIGNLLVNGIFVFNPNIKQEKELLQLRSSLPPFILAGDTPEEDLNYVDSDNLGDTEKGVKFLLSRGHKRILFLNYSRKYSPPKWRWRGYKKAIKESGVQYDPALAFCFGKKISEEDEKKLQHLLTSSSLKPSAVFSAGYRQLDMFFAWLNQTQLKSLGESLEAMLYDDDNDALSYLGRPYFVIQQPMKQIGRTAALKLVEMVRSGKNRDVKLNLPSTLVYKKVSLAGKITEIQEVEIWV